MSELVRNVALFEYQVPKDPRTDHLPSQTREDLGIIESTRSHALIDLCGNILGKLARIPEFSGELKEVLESIVPVICDGQSLASMVTGIGKPVLTISKDLIEHLENEDQIAFVLFHEVGHSKYKQLFQSSGSTAPEEFTADCWAAKWLVQTGYDWRAAESLFKHFEKNSSKDEDATFIQRLKKAHPENENRIKCIRTYLGACELKDPSFEARTVPPTILGQEYREIARGLKFATFFDALKEGLNYETLPTTQKVQVLLRVAYDLIQAEVVPETRVKALWKALVEVTAEKVTDREKEKLTHLAHTFFDLCCGTKLRASLPKVALHCLITGEQDTDDKRKILPLGVLAKVDLAATRLVQAENIEEAKTKAEHFLALYARHYRSSLQYDSDRFRFLNNVPALQNGEVPWKRLVDGIGVATPDSVISALAHTPVRYDRNFWRKLNCSQLELVLGVELPLPLPNGLAYSIQKTHRGVEFGYNRFGYNSSTEEACKGIFENYVRLRKLEESPEVELPDKATDIDSYVSRYRLLLQYPWMTVDPDFQKYDENQSNKEVWGQHSKNIKPLCDHLLRKILTSDETESKEWASKACRVVGGLFHRNYSGPRIPLDSPVVSFIESLPENLLSSGGKISYLLGLPLEIWQTNIAEQMDWLSSKCQLELPKNIRELTKFLIDYDNVCTEGQLAYIFSKTLKLELASGIPINPFNADSISLIRNAWRCTNRYSDKDEVIRDAKNTLRNYVFNNADISSEDLKVSLADMQFNNLVDLHNILATRDLFPSLDVRSAFEEVLVERIKGESTLNSQAALADRLLKSQDDPEAICSLKTNSYCQRLVAMRIGNLLGKDDGSARFMLGLKTVSDVLDNGGVYNSRRAILTMLADDCEMQKEAAFYVRDKLNRRHSLSSELEHVGVKGFEPLLKAVGSDPIARVVFIDFLSRPLSSGLLSDLVNDITDAKKGTRLSRLTESRKFYEFKNELNSAGRNSSEADLTVEQENVRLHSAFAQIHSYYQSLDLERRALILDQLLSPAQAVTKDSSETTRQAVSLCLNRVFPASIEIYPKAEKSEEWEVLFLDGITKPVSRLLGNRDPVDIWKKLRGAKLERRADSPVVKKAMAIVALTLSQPNVSDTDRQHQKLARDFIGAYLEASSELERPLLVAAIMAASEQSKATHTFGECIANLLEILGPAYIKLGQAAHSLPETPQEIKEPLARLKSRALPPKRWEVFERFDQTIPSDTQSRILRVGKTLGSASFNVSTQVLYDHHGKKEGAVASILRENARPDAERGFLKLAVCAERLGLTHPEFQIIAPTLIELIEQARILTTVETDVTAGFEQASYARKQYDGLQIRIGNSQYNLKTAEWLEHFPEGRISREVLGEHFNDLRPSNTDERNERKRVAQAYVLAELRNLLSGDRFDCDRHGDQLRIDKNQIGIFDHGGLARNPPSEEDKRQLGKIISETKKRGSFAEFSSVLQESIQIESRLEESSKKYLLHIQRGMLAMSDFLDLLEPQDYTEILKALALNNDIDPIFRKALGITRLTSLLNAVRRPEVVITTKREE